MSNTRRGLRASSAVVIAALALVAVGTPAHAAVGDKYKYYGSFGSGSSIRLEGQVANTTTGLFGVQGQSGAKSFDGYSIDLGSTQPASNNNYTEVEWNEANVGAAAVQNKAAIAWILRNSYPSVTESKLRDIVRATDSSFPTGSFPASEAIAGTQAAIWHFSNGADLNLSNTIPNTSRVKKLYSYLVQAAAQAQGDSADAPTAAIQAGATADEVSSIGLVGPFTVTGNSPLALSVSGLAPSQLSLVGANGQALAGTVAPGGQFWLKPSAELIFGGSVVLQGNTAAVNLAGVQAVSGASNVAPYAARTTLVKVGQQPYTARTELAVSWTVGADAPATTREYRHAPKIDTSVTLQKIRFVDGSVVTTDVVPLQGQNGASSVSVYKERSDAAAPANWTRYLEQDWGNADQLTRDAVTWILANSYPTISTSELSQRVAAGADLGGANVKDYNAIAATQAAIWHFTEGRDLNVRPYGEANSVTASSAVAGFDAAQLLNDSSSTGWRAATAGEATLDFVFPSPVEIRSYSIQSLEGGSAAAAPQSWRLLASTDGGQNYREVSSSAVTLDRGAAFVGGSSESKQKVLGGSATLGGATHYRVVLSGSADAAVPVEIASVSFDGRSPYVGPGAEGGSVFPNDPQVVHTYNYLIAGAAAQQSAGAPRSGLAARVLVSDSQGTDRLLVLGIR